MQKSGKLELTWVGKYEQKEIEPRILVEDKSKSYGDPDSENMLIHGDNLIALKALEQDYAGRIKCVYIDPPYNIDAAGVPYVDNIEHSLWLSIMKSRLQCLYELLTEGGFLFVQIDDEEYPYLAVLIDEVFGRSNRVNTIAVKMSEPTGVKMSHVDKRLPKLKEYILVYKKGDIILNEVKVPKEKWDKEYKLFITNATREGVNRFKEIMNSDNAPEEMLREADEIVKSYEIVNIEEIFKLNGIVKEEDKDKFRYDNAWRILRDVATTGGAKTIADNKRKSCSGNFFVIQTPQKKIYLIKNNYNEESSQPRIKMLFADDYLMVNPCDLWTDISTTGLDNEGVVEFPKSKKPEKLISRILEIATNKDDIVLDSFLGSGTTAAVAHKMGRRWIGIELGDHAYTHCKVRMDKVIDGEQGGISKAVNWQGGGGYKFYELAPSLLVPNPKLPTIKQINPEYTFEMMCEAICKLEGFRYKPDGKFHGKSSEQRFIHITKEFVNGEYINSLLSNLGKGQSLLVYGMKIQSGLRLPDNIIVKKIPKDLLDKCTFESEVK